MRVLMTVDEDFSNYKTPAMLLSAISCSFKCEKDCGIKCCHNSPLLSLEVMNIEDSVLIDNYMKNPITSAVVIAGLEPFDQYDEVLSFIQALRQHTDDDVVIYTGYTEQECAEKIEELKQFCNIIVKFGRFIPNQQHHFDEVLGVELASENQYGRKIS